MSTGISCDCTTVSFGNVTRTNCVIEQKALAFPMFVPRYGSNGTRNTIDLAADPATFLDPTGALGAYATLGAYIKDKVENPAFAPEDRFYPTPKVEEATFERTDTIYETAPSGRKVKLDGIGGIRTFAMKLWAKDAVHGIQRELDKFGCSDLDFFYVDITGAIWGVKDDASTAVIRGYEMDTESFDVFREYATDTTTQKLNLMFDLDRDECEQNSYVVTTAELGYKGTALKSPITVSHTVTNPTTTTILSVLYMEFGTGKTPTPLTELVGTDFVITSDVTGVLAHAGDPTESPAGSYLTTMDAPLVSGHVITVEVAKVGYDIQTATFTVV